MKFLETEINEKIFKKTAIFFLILIFIFAFLILIQYSVLKPFELDKRTDIDVEDIAAGVVVEQGSRMLELSGYAYKKGQKIEVFDSNFVIKNIETGKMYLLDTSMEKNHDLMAVDGEYDCSNAGMRAKAFIIGLRPGIYEICIIYNNDGEDIFKTTGVNIEIK